MAIENEDIEAQMPDADSSQPLDGVQIHQNKIDQHDWHPLEKRIGWRFHQHQLLLEALTHRSYVYEKPAPGLKHNERLEFLGDAILAFLSADYLFQAYPALSEGELTTTRAALVKTTTLADFARRLQLGEYLRMGRGEERTGGRSRDALLAAAFEALLGAIYLDNGLDMARQFVLPFLEEEARPIVSGGRFKDNKTLLQELAQAHLGITPTYRVIAEEGPAHSRSYTVEVVLGENPAGRGQGRNKQGAEQEAALQALEASGWISS
jgi:ribonuclease-3